MKLPFILGSLVALVSSAQAAPSSFPLWANDAPGALGKEDKDIPTLTIYLPEPEKATGAAFVICPGGGYGGLANHEGDHYARFLNEQGIQKTLRSFSRRLVLRISAATTSATN